MAGFFNCGFTHVAAKNRVYNENGKLIRDKNTRLQKFMSIFGDNIEAFAVNQNAFDNQPPVLLRNFEKWRGETKSKYLEHFSPTAWRSLSPAKRGMHSVSKCRGCHVNHLSFQSLFPLKTNRLKGVDPMSVSLKETTKLRKVTKQLKPSKATLQETAKNIYLKIKEPFKDLFDTDLAEALTKISEIGLANAKTKAQKKKERRDNARCLKKKIEGQWSKVDCDTLLATRQSFKQREFQRKSLYFESTEEGKKRTQKRKALEDAGLRKKKCHSPDPNLVDFDKESLLQEVNTMKEDEKVSLQFIKQ